MENQSATQGGVEGFSATDDIQDHESVIDPGSEDLAVYVEERRAEFAAAAQDLTLSDAYSRYELVSAHYDPAVPGGSFIVMAERDPGMTRSAALQELGYSSPSPWTSFNREEWNPELRDHQGLIKYYRMKRTDGSVRGSLRQLKTPVLDARWRVVPRSQSTIDKNIAQFVHDNLFHRMSRTWSMTLEDVLLMCDYGFMVMEKVYDNTIVPGKVVIRKLAPRHPLDIQEWIWDSNGGPDGVVMAPNPSEQGIDNLPIFIPIRKLAIFSLEAEAGDLRGTSILRSAHKHWYFKDTMYKIDAIQKERHGIGVPCIKLPPNFSPADKRLAEELGRNLRTNERGHVVLPPGWELLFLKLEGQPVDCIKSIEHHDGMIWQNVLARFAQDPASKVDNGEMFLRSARYVGSTIADIFNSFIIKQLVDFNFRRGEYPEIKPRRIGEENEARTRSFTARNYTGAGMLTPDDPLEDAIRDDLDLPPRDPSTARTVATPQGGPKPPTPSPAGPPRQKTTPPGGTGQRNTGTDRSGGENTPSAS